MFHPVVVGIDFMRKHLHFFPLGFLLLVLGGNCSSLLLCPGNTTTAEEYMNLPSVEAANTPGERSLDQSQV